jgi:hypothetical protein
VGRGLNVLGALISPMRTDPPVSTGAGVDAAGMGAGAGSDPGAVVGSEAVGAEAEAGGGVDEPHDTTTTAATTRRSAHLMARSVPSLPRFVRTSAA